MSKENRYKKCHVCNKYQRLDKPTSKLFNCTICNNNSLRCHSCITNKLHPCNNNNNKSNNNNNDSNNNNNNNNSTVNSDNNDSINSNASVTLAYRRNLFFDTSTSLLSSIKAVSDTSRTSESNNGSADNYGVLITPHGRGSRVCILFGDITNDNNSNNNNNNNKRRMSNSTSSNKKSKHFVHDRSECKCVYSDDHACEYAFDTNQQTIIDELRTIVQRQQTELDALHRAYNILKDNHSMLQRSNNICQSEVKQLTARHNKR